MVRSPMRGEHAIKVVRPVAIREVIRFRTHASHISLIKTRKLKPARPHQVASDRQHGFFRDWQTNVPENDH
jgi:hypothetical protein